MVPTPAEAKFCGLARRLLNNSGRVLGACGVLATSTANGARITGDTGT